MKIKIHILLMCALCTYSYAFFELPEKQFEINPDQYEYSLENLRSLFESYKNSRQSISEEKRFDKAKQLALYLGLYPEIVITHIGYIYINNGSLDIAMQCAENAVKANDRYAEGYILRGRAHSLLGNNELCESDFNKAVELSTSARAYQYRGVMYYNTDRIELAIQDMEAALMLKPDNEHVLSWLGFMYFKTSQSEKALHMLNQVIAMDNKAGEYLYGSIKYGGLCMCR